jgi:hypothetical protein
MKRIKFVEITRNTSDVQICFCSYLVHDSSKEALELAEKGPKFP